MKPLHTLSKDILMILNHLGAIPRRNDIDARQVELWIAHWREWWINEKFNKSRDLYYTVRQALVQDLGCQTLLCVDQAECDAVPFGLFVAKVVIPTPVEVDGCLDYVGVINKRWKFIECKNANELDGRLKAPYADKFVFYYRIGPNNLYIATADSKKYFDLCYVNIRMICADPSVACYKKSLSSSVCCYDPANDSYPITGDMMEDIKMLILTRECNIAMHNIRDYRDNNRDDRIAGQPQPVR